MGAIGTNGVRMLNNDGIATGATAQAAVSVIRAQHPARLVLAAPVAQNSAANELAREVDEVVCVVRPSDIEAVSFWYAAFPEIVGTALCLTPRLLRE